MGFMAGFWGSAASAHQETTQNWKQLFQVDKQLKLQEEKQRQEDLRAQVAHDLDLKKFEESSRQFNVNEELARLRLALEQDEFNLDYARNYFEDFSPRLEGLPFLQQVDALATLENDLAGNRFAAPYLTGIRNTINTQTMSESQALSVLNGYFNPTMDEHGRPQRTPYFLVETALESLEEMGSTYVTDAREEVKNVRKSIEEDYEYNSNMFREFREAELDREHAAAEQARASAGHSIALTGNVEEDTRQMTDLFDLRRDQLQAQIEGLNLSNASQEMRNNVTEDLLEQELRHARASADMATMESEVYEQTKDYMVRTIAAQTGVSEAEARVAMATVDLKVQREKIGIDEVGANIRLMEAQASNLSVDSERIREAIDQGRIKMASEIILSNRTDLWEAFGRELLEPILGDEWEAVSEIVGESIQKFATEEEKMREADFLFKQAQTEETEAKARLADITAEMYPSVVAIQQLSAQASMTGAQAQARNAQTNAADLAFRQMEAERRWQLDSAPPSFDAALTGVLGNVSGGADSFSLAPLNQQEADIKILRDMLDNGTFNSEGAAQTLAPILERNGLAVPGLGEGEFSQAALAEALDGLEANHQISMDAYAQRLSAVTYGMQAVTGQYVDARDVAQRLGLTVGMSPSSNNLADSLVADANSRGAVATHNRDVHHLGSRYMFDYARSAQADGGGISWVVGQAGFEGLYGVMESNVARDMFDGDMEMARALLESAGGEQAFFQIYQQETAELQSLVDNIANISATTGVPVDLTTNESTAQALNDVMFLRDDALENASTIQWMANVARESSDYMTADPTSDTAVQHYNVIDQMSQMLGMSVEDMVSNGFLYQTSFRGVDGQNHPVYHPTENIADPFNVRARELDPLVNNLVDLARGWGRADLSTAGINIFGGN